MADSAASAIAGDIDDLSRHSLEFPADASSAASQVGEMLAFLESWEGDEELLALEGEGGGDASTTAAMPLLAAVPRSSCSTWRALEDSSSTSLSFSATSGEEKRVREKFVEGQCAATLQKKKRVRRVVEITQLRQEASVLEKTLSDLSEYWKNVRTQAPCHISVDGRFTDKPVFRSSTNSSAERNALRQRQLRSSAEEENRKLRDEYQVRRKNARAFYKLLKRRATMYPVSVIHLEHAVRICLCNNAFANIVVVTSTRTPTYTYQKFNCVFQLMQHSTASQDVFARSGDIFQALFQDVHRMHVERGRIDSVIDSHRRSACTFRDWNVREDSDVPNGIFLELVDSAVLPFDRLQVNKAMHRLYSKQTSTTTYFCEYSHTNTDKDMLVRQAVCAYSTADGDGHVRHQEVVCNESDDTHSLFLRVARIQPVGPTGKPIKGLVLLEKQWTVIRSGGGGNNDDHEASSSTSDDGGALSTVQSYHKITLVSVDKDYEAFWTKGVLMDSTVPVWNASCEKTHQRLESLLIEQGIRNSRRLQASEVQQ